MWSTLQKANCYFNTISVDTSCKSHEICIVSILTLYNVPYRVCISVLLSYYGVSLVSSAVIIMVSHWCLVVPVVVSKFMYSV